MKFLKANIDGFGKWVNTEFDLEDTNLTCFYGKNEAGKSTLQQFILYIVFGLPPKKRKKFIPRNSTEISGQLTVYSASIGYVRLKRQADLLTCYLPDGSSKGEAWWQEQITGLSRDLYEAIYAFSQQDLQKMRTLDKTEVSDVLFSIALSGSTAISETEKQLANDLEGLYKPRGHKPQLNQQISKVSDLYSKLQTEKLNEAAYIPLNKEIAAYTDLLHQQKNEQRNLQHKLIMIDTLEQSIPSIQTYQAHKMKLSAYKEQISFPNEGIERYEQLKAFILPLQSKRNVLRAELDDYMDKYNNLSKEVIPDEELNRAEALVKEGNNYELRLKQLITLEKELQDLKEKQAVILNKLMLNVDEWSDISIPFHLETSWGQLKDDLDRHKEAHQTINENRLLLQEKKDNYLREEQQLTQRLISENNIEDLENKLLAHRQLLENDEQKRTFQSWQEREQKKRSKISYFCFGTAIAAAVAGLIMNEAMLYGAALILLIAGGLNIFFTRNNKRLLEAMFITDHAEQRFSDEDSVRYQQILEQQRLLKEDLSYIQKELKKIDFDELQLEEQQSIILNREQQLSERIKQEQFTYPFLLDREVNYWPDLLVYLRDLEKIDLEITQIEQSMEKAVSENETILQQLKAFGYGEHFRDLEILTERQMFVRQSIKQFEQSIESFKQQLLKIAAELRVYEEEVSVLFKAAETVNEDQFYEKYKELKTREQLMKEMESIKIQLQNLFSEETAAGYLNTEINQTETELKRQQIKQSLDKLDDEIAVNNRKTAELHVKVKQLEQSDDISSLNLQFEIEKEALNEQAEQWAILKLASTALKKAKASYQEKYFNDVMKLTSKYFSRITEGKYHSVFPPGNNSVFQVEGNNDMRYTVDELSQGTIDQIYVALRLAIAKVMNHYVNMPLLIDDAFVHFDGARTTDASNLLTEISSEQQIIFFTCKEDMLNHFRTVKQIEPNYIVK